MHILFFCISGGRIMRLYDYDDVVGNTATLAIMRQSLHNGMFPHISVYGGVYGTGKSTCAEITAMALTCENEKSDNPCGVCPTCKANIQAFQTTGESSWVHKVNVGQKNSKADVDDMIRDIFVLQSGNRNSVYIIEEAHSLNDVQQTALLEELDKIASNVYVIFCTTKPTRLLKELRSRAIMFNFNRLNNAESTLLLNKCCEKSKVSLDRSVKNLIIGYSKGVPRQITNLVEFIANGQFQSQTIAEFLGVINNSFFINLLETMVTNDLQLVIVSMEDLLARYSIDLIVEQMKIFMLNVVFLIEGGVHDDFTADDMERVQAVMLGKDVLSLNQIVQSIKYNATEAEFKYGMLKLRQAMRGKSVGNIITDNAVEATAQKYRAKHLVEERHAVDIEQANENPLTALDLNSLTQMGVFK